MKGQHREPRARPLLPAGASRSLAGIAEAGDGHHRAGGTRQPVLSIPRVLRAQQHRGAQTPALWGQAAALTLQT